MKINGSSLVIIQSAAPFALCHGTGLILLDSVAHCTHLHTSISGQPGVSLSLSPLRSEKAIFLGNNLTGKKHQFSCFHSQP